MTNGLREERGRFKSRKHWGESARTSEAFDIVRQFGIRLAESGNPGGTPPHDPRQTVMFRYPANHALGRKTLKESQPRFQVGIFLRHLHESVVERSGDHFRQFLIRYTRRDISSCFRMDGSTSVVIHLTNFFASGFRLRITSL